MRAVGDLRAELEAEAESAIAKAWDAASRRKFWMFGYYAARAHYLRDKLGIRGPGPFIEIQRLAKSKVPARSSNSEPGGVRRAEAPGPADEARAEAGVPPV
jgi:hypothetical protein